MCCMKDLLTNATAAELRLNTHLNMTADHKSYLHTCEYSIRPCTRLHVPNSSRLNSRSACMLRMAGQLLGKTVGQVNQPNAVRESAGTGIKPTDKVSWRSEGMMEVTDKLLCYSVPPKSSNVTNHCRWLTSKRIGVNPARLALD